MIAELCFTVFTVLGIALWQLVSISREIRRDRANPDSPERPRHPIGEHRLDDR